MKRAFHIKASLRSLFLFLLFHLAFLSYSQDVYTVFYPSGENKLLDQNKSKIRKFIYSINIKKIDSLQVVGFADSTGKAKLNYRLSLKRAQKVSAFLQQLLRKKFPITTIAKGEEGPSINPNINHRRVEIYLYFAGRALEDSTEQLEYFGNTKTCFVLSDTIMKNAHINRVEDGKSNYVILEMEPHLFAKDQKYYSLSKNSLYAKVLKWKLVQSGAFWWYHERYMTRIKESDFDAFGVLTKKIIPENYNECVVCDKDIEHALKMTSELLPDAVVMQHLQIQKIPFKKSCLLIVPAEYINDDKTYYADNQYDHEIKWTSKFGLRNRPYAFAEVPNKYIQAPLFSIFTHHQICLPKTDSLVIEYPIDTLTVHSCKPESRGGVYALEYGLEASFWNYDYHALVFAGFLQYVGTKWEYALHTGIDLKARFQMQLRADYNFYSFSLFKTNYMANADRSFIHDFHRTFNTYAGSDLTWIYGNKYNSLNHSIYLGLAYRNNPFSFGIDRIYTQVGITANYLRSSFTTALYFRIGLKFKI